MNPELLQAIGLTKSQALTYLKLIEKGELSPPEVAELTGESRSNSYMILQRLEQLGLVEKLEKSKKLVYQPQNPLALEQLAEQKKQDSMRIENQIKHSMPHMLSYFYSFTEKPGIRLLQGVDGLKEIYTDTLRTKQDIYFLRTPAEVITLGADYFERYKKRRAALGIKTHAFTQESPSARRYAVDDKINKMVRTWLKPEAYDAPVEINVYGDKVAFLAYGEDVMGVIIQNPPIAEAMRQLLNLIS
ncbi:MAG TPA: helix-turn-helix domain-containing protein [Patescibacteria group bacterium]|nr:helix-turn-helix domain-containing protein [Patescibacteria group bacterium]